MGAPRYEGHELAQALFDLDRLERQNDVAGLRDVLLGERRFNGSLQAEAIVKLRRLGARETAPDIVPFLSDESEDVKLSAIRALAIFREPSPPTVRAIEGIVDNANPVVRQRAIEALGFIGADTAVPTIIAKLAHPDSGTRVVAARALAAIGDPRGIEPLERQTLREGLRNGLRLRCALHRLRRQAAARSVSNKS